MSCPAAVSRFCLYFKTICASLDLSTKYLWIHMTWSSSAMFILVLAFNQNIQKHSQKQTHSWHYYSVKGQGSMRTATNSHHCCAQGSFHCSMKIITQTASTEIKEKLARSHSNIWSMWTVTLELLLQHLSYVRGLVGILRLWQDFSLLTLLEVKRIKKYF